jgi:alkylated DNA repair dioxygenase AlkB
MTQQELFSQPSDSALDGLRYQPEFLDVAGEKALLATLQTLPMQEAQYKEYRAHRRIVSYGGKYDFDRNELLEADPIPAWLHPLREQVASWSQRSPEEFTHAMIAEYRAGTPLGWHRDVPHFERIVGVSLLGTCRMRFRPYPPTPHARGAAARPVTLPIAPRSIYILEGAARWDWQHSVAPTPSLRYSITFRTLRAPTARTPNFHATPA